MGSHPNFGVTDKGGDPWKDWQWSKEGITAQALLASWGLPLAVKLDGEDYGKLAFGTGAPDVDVNEPLLLVRAQRSAKMAATSLMPRQAAPSVPDPVTVLPKKVKGKSANQLRRSKAEVRTVRKKVGTGSKKFGSSLWCEKEVSQKRKQWMHEQQKHDYQRQGEKQQQQQREAEAGDARDPWKSVGPHLVVPLSYPGWFHLLSHPDQEGRRWNSIRDVTKSKLSRFLSCSPLTAYSLAQCNSRGEKVFMKQTTPSGEIFQAGTVCKDASSAGCCGRIFNGGCGKPDDKYLLCTDTSGKELLLPLTTSGKFMPVSPDGAVTCDGGTVHCLEKIARQVSLPAVVRLVYGRTPWSTDRFTGTLKLEGQHWEETIVACSLGKRSSTLMELPVDARVRFLPALNFELLRFDDVIQDALEFCSDHVDEYMASMKVVQNFYHDDEPLTPDLSMTPPRDDDLMMTSSRDETIVAIPQRSLPPLPIKPPPSEAEEKRHSNAMNLIRTKPPRKMTQVDSGISCDGPPDEAVFSEDNTGDMDSDYETIPFDKRTSRTSELHGDGPTLSLEPPAGGFLSPGGAVRRLKVEDVKEDDEGYLVPCRVDKPPVVPHKPSVPHVPGVHKGYDGYTNGSSTLPLPGRSRTRRHVFGDEGLTIVYSDAGLRQNKVNSDHVPLIGRDIRSHQSERPNVPQVHRELTSRSCSQQRGSYSTLPTRPTRACSADGKSTRHCSLKLPPQTDDSYASKRLHDFLSDSLEQLGMTPDGQGGNKKTQDSGTKPLKTKEDVEAFLDQLFDCEALDKDSPRLRQRTGSSSQLELLSSKTDRSPLPLHRNSRSLSQFTLVPFPGNDPTSSHIIAHHQPSGTGVPTSNARSAARDNWSGYKSGVTRQALSLAPVNFTVGKPLSEMTSRTLGNSPPEMTSRCPGDDGPEYANCPVLGENSSSSKESDDRDGSSLSSIYQRMRLTSAPSPLPCRTCVRKLSLTDSGVFLSPSREDCDCACKSVSDWSWRPPDDLSHLTVEEVMLCLRYIGLAEPVVDLFSDAQIDGLQFVELDPDLLREGFPTVNALQRKKVMDFIRGWRPKIWV